MKLRPYQETAIQKIYESWSLFDKTLLVFPTGTGKTIVFSHIAKREIDSGKRVLILAHRDELLQQAQDKLFRAVGVNAAIEKAESTALDSFFPVTCGSVQTLMRKKRLERFPRDFYQTIIVDETHHILSQSYQNILNYFSNGSPTKVLGVTATPDRGDKKNLGKYFDDLAYEYSIRDAISEGYLCPITAETIPLKIDISNVRETAGDYNDADLGDSISPFLSQIAENIPRDRKILVFLPLIDTSKHINILLQMKGYKSEHLDGTSQNRREVLARFKSGETQIICNSMLLTEGFDEPSIDCIVCLRPTKIRSFFAQVVGRGTRPFPGKQNLLILDFLWQTATHDLCHPASLIAENEEVSKRMTEIQNVGGYKPDLIQLEIQAKSSLAEERERSLAEELKRHEYKQRKFVNPLEFALSIHAEDLQTYEPLFKWEAHPPSDNQINLLVKWGFNSDEIPNKGFASKLIDRCISRSKLNMASPKQIKCLKRYGIDGTGLSFNQASENIDKIAQNGWRVPE
jgi:superfamily II DNA or RNA helicase